MPRKKKKSFRFWPQVIVGALGLVAVFLSIFFLVKNAPTEPEISPGVHIGKTTLLSYQGKDVLASELLSSEKNLLIFWATWCGPCVDEIKKMPQLLPKIKAKGYTPVFINYDSPENKVIAENFAKEFGVESAFDLRGEILFNLGISSLPVSILVDKSGKVLRTFRGEMRESRL
ncbi:MAG: redoxin family protein [Bdellovibrionota bacterium]